MRDGIIEDTPVAQCATGCRVRGAHLSSCLDPCGEACDRRCDEHCRGCQPKRAHGNLAVCRHCRDQVALAINAIPTLVSWIATQDTPSSGAAPSSGDKIKRTKKSPPLPFRADAIDAADALHALLVSWVRTVVEKRPGALTGPDLAGSVSTRKVLADRTGAVVGLGVTRPPRASAGRHTADVTDLAPATGAEGPSARMVERFVDRLNAKGEWADEDWVIAPSPTRNAATWLAPHLEWALEQPWAGDMVHELTTAVRQARRRWPVEPRPEVAEAECFDCGAQLQRPVGDKGYEDDYVCSGCQRRYTYLDYLRALRQLHEDKRRDMRARVEAGDEEGGTELAFVAVKAAAEWVGRKEWTIRGWIRDELVRSRKLSGEVRVHLYDVTREHMARPERKRVCLPDE